MKIITTKQIEIYSNPNGRKPFVEWLEALDKNARFRIKERLDRVSLGNLGDHKPIEQGVSELRFKFNSGYRIYYAEKNAKIILLLSGGDKATQKHDIKKAIAYWQDYLLG